MPEFGTVPAQGRDKYETSVRRATLASRRGGEMQDTSAVGADPGQGPLELGLRTGMLTMTCDAARYYG